MFCKKCSIKKRRYPTEHSKGHCYLFYVANLMKVSNEQLWYVGNTIACDNLFPVSLKQMQFSERGTGLQKSFFSISKAHNLNSIFVGEI